MPETEDQLHRPGELQALNQLLEPIYICVRGAALLGIRGAFQCEGHMLCLVGMHELQEEPRLKGSPVREHVGIVLQDLLCQISCAASIHIQ